MDGRQRAARLRRARTGSWWCTSPTRRSCGSIFERFAADRLGDGAGAGAAGRGRLTPSAASRSTRATSTSCSTTGPTSGSAVHKGTAYPGEHAAIIDQELWDKVHAILAENARTRSANTRAQTPALLKGLIFGPTGAAMSPTHTRKGNRLYRYYVSQDVLKRRAGRCPVGRVPAAEIEAAVVDQLRGTSRQPEIIVGTWRGGAGRAGRHHRGRGAGGAAAARPAVGRAVPGRAGADCPAPGGARGDRSHRCRHPVAAGGARESGPGPGRPAAERFEVGRVTTATSITVHVPLTIRHRPGRRTVVTPEGTPGVAASLTRADPGLVKALARAFRWKRMLEEGRCSSISEIASTEKIDRGYVGSILRLTLLAPDIVEAILDGRQPERLGLPAGAISA